MEESTQRVIPAVRSRDVINYIPPKGDNHVWRLNYTSAFICYVLNMLNHKVMLLCVFVQE